MNILRTPVVITHYLE